MDVRFVAHASTTARVLKRRTPHTAPPAFPGNHDAWVDARADGAFVVTMHAREYDRRLGMWETVVWTEEAADTRGDPLVRWFFLTRAEAIVGHQLAVANLNAGWRGGAFPDTDVVFAISPSSRLGLRIGAVAVSVRL